MSVVKTIKAKRLITEQQRDRETEKYTAIASCRSFAHEPFIPSPSARSPASVASTRPAPPTRGEGSQAKRQASKRWTSNQGIYAKFSSVSLFLCCSVLSLFLAACARGGPTAQIEATSTPIPTAPAVARPTYVVQRGDVQEIFEFTGRWQPRDQMQLSFEVNGTVRRVNVQRGDTVAAGDLLADLQIDDLEGQLASAELELETALANLNSGEAGELDSVTSAQISLANERLALDNANANSPWPRLE